MKIESIKIYSDDGSMGEATEAECDWYRGWMQQQLDTEYPDADIEVMSEPSTSSVEVSCERWEDDETATQEVKEYANRMWDRCPWETMTL